MAYIYKIINSVNDKVYIGQTIRSLEVRFKQHLYDAKRYKDKSNSKLYNAMNKYGDNKFSITIVEECEPDLLDDREKYWIKQYDSFHNGYNTTLGGFGHSIDDSESILNAWNDGLIVNDISKLTHHSMVYTIQTLLNNNVTHEQMKERARKSQSDKVKVPVYQYDLDGNYIASHKSIWDVEVNTGINHSCINGVLCGAHYSAGFYQWSRKRVDNIGKCKHQFCGTARNIYQYTLDGEYVCTYPSFTQAAKAVGLKSIKPIRMVCYNKAHTSAGYRWSFEKYDILPVE